MSTEPSGRAIHPLLKTTLLTSPMRSCACKLIEEIATIKSMDVILPVERGGVRADLRLRVVAKPEADAAQLLARLGLQIPRQSKFIENVVPKIAFKSPATPINTGSDLSNCGTWVNETLIYVYPDSKDELITPL